MQIAGFFMRCWETIFYDAGKRRLIEEIIASQRLYAQGGRQL